MSHRRHTPPVTCRFATARTATSGPSTIVAAERASPVDVLYPAPVHRMVLDLLRADRRRALPDLPTFARCIGLEG